MAGRVFAGMARVFGTALGEPVAYAPATGAPVTVKGIFTRDYYAAMEDGELQAASYKPAVSLAAADCPNAAEGDGFTIAGQAYVTAAPPQPDGFGMVAFILHEASA